MDGRRWRPQASSHTRDSPRRTATAPELRSHRLSPLPHRWENQQRGASSWSQLGVWADAPPDVPEEASDRSSVTGATCRRLPEVESGSCPCPSASASAPQALSSRSPALGHCPGGPQQPRIALRPAGVSLAVFTHCLAPDGAPRKAGCRVPGLSSVRTTTATPRFRCLLFPPNSFVIIYIFLKLPTSCFVTRRSQTPALASAVCRCVPGTRLAQAASTYLSLA